ncbi:RRP15-like protein [Argonauta hians]
MAKRKQSRISEIKEYNSDEEEEKSEMKYVIESGGEEASDEESEDEKKKTVKKKKKKKVSKKTEDGDSNSGEEQTSSGNKQKAKPKKYISKTKTTNNEEDKSISKTKKTNDDDDDDGDDDDGEVDLVGFADAITKILERTRIPEGKNNAILSKGKTDKEIQKHKLERLRETNPEEFEEEITDFQNQKDKLEQRKMKLLLARTKPNVLEKNKERQLKAIATQGIVQLFNAVQKQQEINEENENTVNLRERKKQSEGNPSEKKSFFHLLQNIPKVNLSSQPEEVATIQPAPEKKIWSFLKDDFLLDANKMKDWVKKEEI